MRISGLIGGVLLAGTLSQFPEFSQQYEQRLGGAVDQLAAVVADFDASAARAGLSRDEALQTYEGTGEPFLADRSRDMQTAFARYEKLTAHLEALATAGPVEKVTAFASYYDADIGNRALESYEPAIPVTAEGFIWAGLGLLGGYGAVAGLFAGARRLRRTGRAAGPARRNG